MTNSLHITAIPGIPIIQPGDDLAALIAGALTAANLTLQADDVLVVTSKIVSKAEGRRVDLRTITPGDEAQRLAEITRKDPRVVELVLRESTEVSRARPGVLIVRHRLGFVSANAGIDQSNVAGDEDTVLLLPSDPDASAAALRERLSTLTGVLIGIVISMTLGVVIGGLAGYYGGRVDFFVQRVIEILRSFPEIPLWMALAAVLPVTWSPLLVYFGITVILAMLDWTGLARAVRSKLLSLREEDYTMAARAMGARPRRIVFRHLIPGVMSHLIATATLSIPGMILGETALSFLGLGLRPPITSWGVLLNEAQNINVVALYPWLMLPVVPVILVILAFNFLGDGLRDAADPYT